MSKHLETSACVALISIAPADGDRSPEGRQRARSLCAATLRGWRSTGDRERARWFRAHIAWIGYPLSPGQLAGSANRHAAWRRRYYAKHPLGAPQGPACACDDDSGFNG